jgi:hypothetical protein
LKLIRSTGCLEATSARFSQNGQYYSVLQVISDRKGQPGFGLGLRPLQLLNAIEYRSATINS